MKNKYKDFKCSCACGVRLRILPICWKNGKALDIGIMKRGERRPKIGVVLRSDEKESLIEFLKFINKKDYK